MQYPGYDTGKVILSEGDWFSFRIHNRVQLQDDAWYFILQDVNGMKHFLPSVYYENYKLVPGEEILCKIDKVNCTGRIYLEPKHPVYHEGEIYQFDLISYSVNGTDNSIIVKEIMGNMIQVPLYDNKNFVINAKQMVCCMVISIKKGIPILEVST